METNDTPINEQESLQIIHNMISAAKSDFKDNGFSYLFWGYLVLVASLGNYVLQFVINYDKPWLPWATLLPIGGLISMIVGARKEKKKKVKTYFDDFFNYLLISFLVCLFIPLFFMGQFQLNCYPVVMMIYGLWLFVTGGALRFKPLIIGGIINWVFAVVALFVTFDLQLLILSAAVLLGYIVPGHLLKIQFNKENV